MFLYVAFLLQKSILNSMNRQKIAIPMGDPAGIGPEIIVKALESEEVQNVSNCIVIGDATVMQKAIDLTKSNLKINIISSGYNGEGFNNIINDSDKSDYIKHNSDESDCITQNSDKLDCITQNGGAQKFLNLVDLKNCPWGSFPEGEVSATCGKAAYEYIEKAISLALEKKVNAIATTPINKESLRAASVPYIGHTEIFGALTGVEDPLTLFEVRGMRVFFLSRHVSLRKSCDLVTKERIEDYVIRCTEALRQLGVTDGTMAVAGLNPHSGEHGLFGNEEVEEIMPAVEKLQKAGFDVVGPVSADSVFHLALRGRYNSVLSLYHDQGHIATKTLDFERTIAITCGMPILRTSVDHGTAFDIAYKNIASPVSMIEAIKLAAKYAPHFINSKK